MRPTTPTNEDDQASDSFSSPMQTPMHASIHLPVADDENEEWTRDEDQIQESTSRTLKRIKTSDQYAHYQHLDQLYQDEKEVAADMMARLETEKLYCSQLLCNLEAEKEYAARLCQQLLSEKSLTTSLQKSIRQEKAHSHALYQELMVAESAYEEIRLENEKMRQEIDQFTRMADSAKDVQDRIQKGIKAGNESLVKISEAYSLFKEAYDLLSIR